jgi:peptidyl-prolyl cis-trans isomerase B (cyclophilin B)
MKKKSSFLGGKPFNFCSVRQFFPLFLLAFLLFSQTGWAAKDTLVVIKTDFGTMKVKLYKETPNHRHNFIKLASTGFYDSLLFHRVIKNFMIQGGDPNSKRANDSQPLGNGEIGYTLPPEFNPSLFHKKGALSAARLGDDVNPEKKSSGCQFYIVQGRTFTEQDLISQESRINMQNRQSLFMKLIMLPENQNLKSRFVAAQTSQNKDSLIALSQIAEAMVAKQAGSIPPFKFSAAQIEAYKFLGGAPHLDGGYTVFGEVIEGLDVIDRIAEVEKKGERPASNVRMYVTIEIVEEK